MSFEKFSPTRSVFALAVTALFAVAPLAAAAQALLDIPSSRVIVGFKKGAAFGGRDAIARSGGRVVHDLGEIDAVSVHLPRAAIAALQRSQHVEYIEEDVARHMFASSSPSSPPYLAGQLEPYGIRMVQSDRLPDTYASNRKLCIIDSGYETAHEDLAGNSVTGENLTLSGQWYTDEASHGTHVGGTISAVNNAGIGVVGVMPNRHIALYIAKVFDSTGSTTSSTINRAALNCMRVGANVVSMSLGGASATRTDERVFNRLAAAGVLPIAAAGNSGDTSISYPAGYSSVMSVAAVDENKNWAPFSQYNGDVEISGPGVSVLSTVPMGTGREASLNVGSTVYPANPMAGSPVGTASAPLANFGLGGALNLGMLGKVCLIQRGGGISFADKVRNCQLSGGVGAVIYNNVAGPLFGTLGSPVLTTIPAIGTSDTDGAAMLQQLGQSATLAVAATNYALFSGTSMATPHVAAVAALVWSYFPSCSATQIRSTLNKSALDIGVPGRDDKTGFGLVQAKAAYSRIARSGCNN